MALGWEMNNLIGKDLIQHGHIPPHLPVSSRERKRWRREFTFQGRDYSTHTHTMCICMNITFFSRLKAKKMKMKTYTRKRKKKSTNFFFFFSFTYCVGTLTALVIPINLSIPPFSISLYNICDVLVCHTAVVHHLRASDLTVDDWGGRRESLFPPDFHQKRLNEECFTRPAVSVKERESWSLDTR